MNQKRLETLKWYESISVRVYKYKHGDLRDTWENYSDYFWAFKIWAIILIVKIKGKHKILAFFVLSQKFS